MTTLLKGAWPHEGTQSPKEIRLKLKMLLVPRLIHYLLMRRKLPSKEMNLHHLLMVFCCSNSNRMCFSCSFSRHLLARNQGPQWGLWWREPGSSSVVACDSWLWCILCCLFGYLFMLLGARICFWIASEHNLKPKWSEKLTLELKPLILWAVFRSARIEGESTSSF